MEPKIVTLADLEVQLAANRGWLVLHIGIGLHSLHQRSALAFEEARILLEDELPVAFLGCELTAAEAVRCSLAFGATPFVHVFHRGERLESMPAPAGEEEIQELVEFSLSYHAERARVR
jgi:hypothetical protein